MGAPSAFDIIAIDEIPDAEMKRLTTRPALMALLFLALVSILFAVIIIHDRDAIDVGGNEVREARERLHSLDEVSQAEFVSVFIYQDEGEMASYMVSDSTPDFDALASAVINAAPMTGERDESFSNLLVFSFSDKSTLELPYSEARNQLIFNDGVYAPSADLAPIIGDIEARFDES